MVEVPYGPTTLCPRFTDDKPSTHASNSKSFIQPNIGRENSGRSASGSNSEIVVPDGDDGFGWPIQISGFWNSGFEPVALAVAFDDGAVDGAGSVLGLGLVAGAVEAWLLFPRLARVGALPAELPTEAATATAPT